MTQQQPLPKFSFAKLKGYTGPKEMGSDLLNFEGPVKVIIEDGAPGTGKEPPHNPNIGWTLRGDDEGAEGSRLLKWTVYQGTSQKGNDLSYQTADVISSCGGLTNEQIDGAAQQSAEVGPEEIVGLCRSKIAYVYVKSGSDLDGRPTTDVDRFISKEKYDQLKATPGAFRKKRPEGGASSRATAPVGNPIQNLGGKPSALGPIAPPMTQPTTGNGPAPQGTMPFSLPTVPGFAPKLGQ